VRRSRLVAVSFLVGFLATGFGLAMVRFTWHAWQHGGF